MKLEVNLTKFILLVIVLSVWSCQTDNTMTAQKKFAVVTHSQFAQFVKKTGYITDAEKFGWSIVQINVFDFSKVDGANWRKPDGIHEPQSSTLPVTQVSYNDAVAYCEWSGTKLPTYDEYWVLIKNDKRKVVTDNNGSISSANSVNILGNVWEITASEKNGDIRLAGGSLFCSPNTCHGTVKERQLYVDKQTANIHIGFAVIYQ